LILFNSEDNTIKIWDVRHAKAVLHSLDQQNGLEDDKRSATGIVFS